MVTQQQLYITYTMATNFYELPWVSTLKPLFVSLLHLKSNTGPCISNFWNRWWSYSMKTKGVLFLPPLQSNHLTRHKLTWSTVLCIWNNTVVTERENHVFTASKEHSVRRFKLSVEKYTVQTHHSGSYEIFAADCSVDIPMVKVMRKKQLTPRITSQWSEY